MGHMHTERKNIRSTKKVNMEEIMNEQHNEPSEQYLPPRTIIKHEHIIQIIAVKFEDLRRTISIDQTRKLWIISVRGIWYVMVIENSDTGPILATRIKSRKRNTS